MAVDGKYYLTFAYKYYNEKNEQIGVKRFDFPVCGFNNVLELYRKITHKNILNILAYDGLERCYEYTGLVDRDGCCLIVYISDMDDLFEDFFEMSDKACIDDDLPF